MPGPLPKPADQRQRRNTSNVVDLELIDRDHIPEPDVSWSAWTVDAWDRAWSSVQAQAWTGEQEPLVWLWAQSLDRYVKLQRIVDADPIVEQGSGGLKRNPAHDMAKDAFKQMLELARELGIPFKSKVALGLKGSELKQSLDSLAARAAAPKDPRG